MDVWGGMSIAVISLSLPPPPFPIHPLTLSTRHKHTHTHALAVGGGAAALPVRLGGHGDDEGVAWVRLLRQPAHVVRQVLLPYVQVCVWLHAKAGGGERGRQSVSFSVCVVVILTHIHTLNTVSRTAVEALDAGLGQERRPLLPRGRRLEEELVLVVRHLKRVPDGLLRRCVGRRRRRREGGKEGLARRHDMCVRVCVCPLLVHTSRCISAHILSLSHACEHASRCMPTVRQKFLALGAGREGGLLLGHAVPPRDRVVLPFPRHQPGLVTITCGRES